jgi:hypothetical protein
MPSFEKSHTKYMARELHIGFMYPLLTGNHRLPDGKGYWYLCNEQSGEEGSEIHQLTRVLRKRGDKECIFARPEQCYGVDRSRDIIKENKKLHPGSNWLAKEWIEAVQDQSLFDPALVYLDTTSFVDGWTAQEMLKETLYRCKKGTVVIANVMMGNPRAGDGEVLFDESALVKNLFDGDHPETFSAWNISPDNDRKQSVYSYDYRASKTLMRSFIFFKGVLPAADKIAEEFGRFKDWCSFFPGSEQIE